MWVMELKHNHALAVELHTGMPIFHHHTIMLFLVYQKQLAIHRLTVDRATPPPTHTHTHTLTKAWTNAWKNQILLVHLSLSEAKMPPKLRFMK